ncbi:carboxymuconolactone decarboxylase family protein [Actinopolyspora mortivallis]|uniref:carboxymuconolactone decarboxylase family protein n=1 Tax=Actinopolyspora mortivallis TaxID=33906 RepID=UPI00036C0197|nr:carboxymuconolactone decarboxylase family protein [Actinopolyspora mortivallis]
MTAPDEGHTGQDRHATGDRIRRQVLGDRYVNTMLRGWEPAKPLLELITEFSWGTVWSRQGLDMRTRSLLNVGMLAALNRPAELRLHVGGALRNGCTVEELAEVALQSAVYAGVPVGIDTMKTIKEVADAVEAEETTEDGNGA